MKDANKLKPGDKIKFRTPDMSFVSNPSQMQTAVFFRYGRKLKTDRFVLVWVENKGEHALLPIGNWHLISICQSQIFLKPKN